MLSWGEWRASGGALGCCPPAVRSEVTSHATLTFLFSLFHLFSFPFCCLFPPCPLCSRDAAKRKAWKLNRVGSLRNIYSSSSTNTEGNRTPPARPHPAFLPMQTWKCARPAAACPLLCLQSALWSFHPFVCVFCFTIHVPFSLLKF